jgi:hypothetical protein
VSVSSEIIVPALRACGAVPASRQPTGPEAADALVLYNNMVSGMRGSLIGQPVVSQQVTASKTGQPGRMYTYGGATQITLTLPTNVKAGARIGASAVGAGNVSVSPGVFKVQGGASTSVAAGSRVWFFDGRGDWVRETDAALTDAVEFEAEVREALVDVLTVRLAQEYGLPVEKTLLAIADEGRAKIKRLYNGAG